MMTNMDKSSADDGNNEKICMALKTMRFRLFR